MVLTTDEEKGIAVRYSYKVFVNGKKASNFNTDELKEAARALEAFIVGNLAAINAALPVRFRDNATLAEKYQLLDFVVDELGKR